MITSYQVSSGNDGEVPAVALTLNYEKIKWTYTELDVIAPSDAAAPGDNNQDTTATR